MAHARLAYEGLLKETAIVKAGGPFGGMRQCGPAGGGEGGGGAGVAAVAPVVGAAGPVAELADDGHDLICPGCQVLPPGAKSCDKHGKGGQQ